MEEKGPGQVVGWRLGARRLYNPPRSASEPLGGGADPSAANLEAQQDRGEGVILRGLREPSQFPTTSAGARSKKRYADLARGAG
jgi:hypothetical protein